MLLNASSQLYMGLGGRTKVEGDFKREIVIQRYIEEVEK